MLFSGSLRGRVELEVFGAFPPALLNAAAGAGLRIRNARSLNEHRLCLSCAERDFKNLEALAERAGCQLRVLRREGGSRSLAFLLRRRFLLLGLLLVFFGLFASSLFLWQIDVRGCTRLSRGEVLRCLSDCGVEPGCFWPGLDTEKVCGEMMLRCPQIGWLSLNVSGSRMTVLLAEREEKPEMAAEAGPADLVAAKGGLVRRVSVYEGRAVVSPGQTVSAGETLALGRLVSLTGESRSVRARGGVMAETWPCLLALRPETEQAKQPLGGGRTRLALVFGKKRINLYGNSGKALDACDKIITSHTLGVEGLFALPIRVVTERVRPYALTPHRAEAADLEARLTALLQAQTEGQVLEKHAALSRGGGLMVLTLRAHCIENIARPKPWEGEGPA